MWYIEQIELLELKKPLGWTQSGGNSKDYNYWELNYQRFKNVGLAVVWHWLNCAYIQAYGTGRQALFCSLSIVLFQLTFHMFFSSAVQSPGKSHRFQDQYSVVLQNLLKMMI